MSVEVAVIVINIDKCLRMRFTSLKNEIRNDTLHTVELPEAANLYSYMQQLKSLFAASSSLCVEVYKRRVSTSLGPLVTIGEKCKC